MKPFVASREVAGIVTFASHDGKVIHHDAQGLSCIDPAIPMARDSIFRIASMTKSVTVAAIMMAVDEGKLCLDDEVAQYIPEYANVRVDGKKPACPITIRHLLSHTAGINPPEHEEGKRPQSLYERAA